MLNTIIGNTFSAIQSAPAEKPADGQGGAPAEKAPASSSQQVKQAEVSRQTPPVKATPTPSETTLSTSTALVPVEAAPANPAADPLADKRAALAKITDTAENWGKGGTVLDAAVEFAAKTSEENRSLAPVEDTAKTPATTGRNTEESARTIAAEQGYSTSKSIFEGTETKGETLKVA